MDGMLRSRLGRRILVAQHMALKRTMGNSGPQVGIINSQTDVLDCLHRAEAKAAGLCLETYGTRPEVDYEGGHVSDFVFLPTHLEYIATEILKNGMRATVEHSSQTKELGKTLPRLQVVIADSSSNVTIRFSDQGGGVSDEIRSQIFEYGFSTVRKESEGWTSQPGAGHRSLAGRGFGLPMSRLYASFYSGNLELFSLDGRGTDCHLKLDKSGNHPEAVGLEGT
mmetsp:Transcript_72963/g.171535  ORF Transcript_72963/g.171535 Transcript_72963/m.171535 type:complete len:224 (-) Transcript_72963:20-691(-)